MTTHKASPLPVPVPVFGLLFVFISSAVADALDVPAGLQSNIINQINGQAGTKANAPKSGDPSALANSFTSAPAPGGKDKLDKMIKQLNGPAPAADAAKNGDASALTNMFKSAPGPGGAAAGAGDALTKIFKRGPPPEAAGHQSALPPSKDSASTQPASSFLCIVMVMGSLSFFVAF
ncbi:hypothetical protein TB1_016270 [Malus domestica]